MDFGRTAAFSETCLCGKSFSLPGTYTHHKRNCINTKKRLAGALEKAKEVWIIRKRRRLGTSESIQVQNESALNLSPQLAGPNNPPNPGQDSTHVETVVRMIYS
jgi:hypothetical protein